jgi:DNA-directed RNA polymerase specialized sigma24 family protein
MKGNADTTNSASSKQNELLTRREIFWNGLYSLLHPLVKHWVYNSGVSSWRGQEIDVSEDIVQEAVFRLLKYARNADKGKTAPIEIPEHMVIVITRHCFIDKWRKDVRLVRYEVDDRTSLEPLIKSKAIDLAEVALEQIYHAWIFLKLADYVVTVSTRQQTALLRDLSQRMQFGQTPTPLQQAFTDKGLDLQQHQGWRSANKREQSQQASNLSISYRKITQWSKEASLQ